MPFELLIEDLDGVRILTLNRPEKRNALNDALTHALVVALEAADADNDVGCVLLTGAGRGFCAGADLTEFEQLTGADTARVETRAKLTAKLHGLIPGLRVPVVAAVNGAARGGGAGLALAADLVIASEQASFGYPEIVHGIVAAVVMANLVRVAGRLKAFELVATAEPISAAEALEAHLVNRVVPHDQLVHTSRTLATELAARSRPAMELTKRLLHRVADVPFTKALEEGRMTNQRMRSITRP